MVWLSVGQVRPGGAGRAWRVDTEVWHAGQLSQSSHAFQPGLPGVAVLHCGRECEVHLTLNSTATKTELQILRS